MSTPGQIRTDLGDHLVARVTPIMDALSGQVLLDRGDPIDDKTQLPLCALSFPTEDAVSGDGATPQVAADLSLMVECVMALDTVGDPLWRQQRDAFADSIWHAIMWRAGLASDATPGSNLQNVQAASWDGTELDPGEGGTQSLVTVGMRFTFRVQVDRSAATTVPLDGVNFDVRQAPGDPGTGFQVET